jgi:hypothetical protein
VNPPVAVAGAEGRVDAASTHFASADMFSISPLPIFPAQGSPVKDTALGGHAAGKQQIGNASAKWKAYRLVDLFKCAADNDFAKLGKWGCSPGGKLKKSYVCGTWPTSIGCQFLTRLNGRRPRNNTLYSDVGAFHCSRRLCGNALQSCWPKAQSLWQILLLCTLG